jgi:hypothetical protein
MEPDPSPTPRAERALVALALALLSALVLWHAPAYLTGDEPLGADSSSHIVASTTLARHLAAGSSGWWEPGLNLGFPLAHYYQPLPHLATALVALLLGGPEETTLSYKLLVVLLLSLAPWTTYLGFRRLDLTRPAALFAALAACTVSTHQEVFALSVRHYLFVGLYTLLWGAALVPLALAEGVRFVQGRGSVTLAVSSFALLFLAHGLLALGLIPVLALVALAVPHPAGATLAGRLARWVGLGALSGLLIAAWLLPQLACSDYFNGWPLNLGEKTVHGLGLAALGGEWVRGTWLDLKRLPVLTLLSALGLLVLALRVRRGSSERVLLIGLAVFTVFTAGRATFGRLPDWVFPPNSRIEGLARWAAMLDLFLAGSAGLGGALLVAALLRLPFFRARRALALACVAALAFALALPRHAQLLATGLTTFPAENDRAAFGRIAATLAGEETPGRVYARDELGHGSHWAMAYLGLLAEKPMTISLAVGGQDSLSFYYLWYFQALDATRSAALARLFDIRYLLTRPGQRLGALPVRFVARDGPYELLRLEGDYGLFEWTSAPRVLAASTPGEARAACLRWLRDEYPRGASFLRLPEPIAAKLPALPASNLASQSELAAAPAPVPALPVNARVLSEDSGLSRYSARVQLEDERAWLVLKVTAHPFWQAEVDGAAAPIHYLSPSFMGLELPRGAHEVVFTFRAPAWQKALLALAPIVLAALIVFERQRRARRGTPAPISA